MKQAVQLKKNVLKALIQLALASSFTHAAEEAAAATAILEEYTAIATKSERDLMRTPGSIIATDFDDLNRIGASNAGDVVRYQSGVSIPFEFSGADRLVPYRGSGFTNYRIRGVEGNRVLLSIDGIRQAPQIQRAGGNGRDYFDTAIFERIEILRGSGSTLYGSDAMGGVVSFSTRSLDAELGRSDKPYALNTRLQYNEVNDEISNVINAGARSGKWYLSVSNAVRFGHETKNDKGDTDANPVDFDSNHILAKASFDATEFQRVTVTAENFTRDEDLDLDTILLNGDGIGSPETFFARNEAEDERIRFSLDYESANIAALWDQFKAKVYYQDSKSETVTDTKTRFGGIISRDRTDEIQFDHDINGLQVELVKQSSLLGIDHTFTYGIELSTETAENDFRRTDRAPTPRDPVERPAYDAADVNRYDLFAQDLIEMNKWLLSFGIRAGFYELKPENSSEFVDQSNSVVEADDYDQFSLSPCISVQRELTPHIVAWARYAHGIRNPGVEDYVGFFNHSASGAFFRQVPNPDLDEETSDSFDLGLKYATPHTEVELTTYYTVYDDFIQVETISTEPGPPPVEIQTAQNVGEVEIYGMEMRVDYQLTGITEELNGFSTGFNFNWAGGRNKTDDDNVSTVDPFEAVMHFGYDSDPSDNPWGIRLYCTYRDKKTDTTRDYPYFVPPSSTVFDLYGYKNFSDRVRIDIGIRNLTDEKYWVWASSSSADHAFVTSEEFSAQPGINGFIAVNVRL